MLESKMEASRRIENQSLWQVSPGTKGEPVDRELNLKGKVCPYTFVESMLALEEMEDGQVLRIVVDYPPAACDVPQSLKREGYEILEVRKVNDTDWTICVRNRPFEE